MNKKTLGREPLVDQAISSLQAAFNGKPVVRSRGTYTYLLNTKLSWPSGELVAISQVFDRAAGLGISLRVGVSEVPRVYIIIVVMHIRCLFGSTRKKWDMLGYHG